LGREKGKSPLSRALDSYKEARSGLEKERIKKSGSFMGVNRSSIEHREQGLFQGDVFPRKNIEGGAGDHFLGATDILVQASFIQVEEVVNLKKKIQGKRRQGEEYSRLSLYQRGEGQVPWRSQNKIREGRRGLHKIDSAEVEAGKDWRDTRMPGI